MKCSKTVFICVAAGLPPETPMKTVFEHFRLDQNTIDFVGHALALYRDDEWVHPSILACAYNYVCTRTCTCTYTHECSAYIYLSVYVHSLTIHMPLYSCKESKYCMCTYMYMYMSCLLMVSSPMRVSPSGSTLVHSYTWINQSPQLPRPWTAFIVDVKQLPNAYTCSQTWTVP